MGLRCRGGGVTCERSAQQSTPTHGMRKFVVMQTDELTDHKGGIEPFPRTGIILAYWMRAGVYVLGTKNKQKVPIAGAAPHMAIWEAPSKGRASTPSH
jgi:hypothetical protein